MAGHDVGVDVDGVDGIHDGNAIVVAQDVEDVAAVALRSVGNEDLVVRHVETPVAVIVLGDRGAEKLVSLLGSVAVESPVGSHLVDGGVHRLADR